MFMNYDLLALWLLAESLVTLVYVNIITGDHSSLLYRHKGKFRFQMYIN